MKCRAAFLVLALVFGSSAEAAAADAFASLPSYRASFKMSMVENSSDASMTSADGQMFFEWKRVCGGYSYVQQSYTNYVTNDGELQRQELASDSFESTDGTRYKFHFVDRMDGTVIEEFDGHGALSPDGKGGVIEYSKPSLATAELPEETIFPTVFTIDIIRAAKAGKHSASRTIFDGMGEDSLYDAVAFIGGVKGPEADSEIDPKIDPQGLLKGHRWWNVSIAFYTEETSAGLPDYEMSARFYDNGVTTNLQFDYGDIVMKGELERIEPTADETCGAKPKP
jgi:EipB-like